MTRVVVASTNPVKLAAAREAFMAYLDEVTVEGMPAPSGVSDQPIGEETFAGARHRARDLHRRSDALGEPDYVVGIEGGIVELAGGWYGFGCMCIVDRHGREATGLSPFFELPPRVTEELLAGGELGPVMDRIIGEAGTKVRGGAIGYLTGDVMGRTELYAQGLIAAMAPFVRPELYTTGVETTAEGG